jgi:hypothetical protein
MKLVGKRRGDIMDENFWDKMLEDVSKEARENALKEGSRMIYALYKNLVAEGFEPNQALYLLAEIIKGGMQNGKN